MENVRPIKVIRLPNGKRVTLGEYVTIWKMVKDIVRDDPELRVRGWSDFPCAADDVLYDLRRGLTDRINLRGGIMVRESRASLSSYAMASAPRVRIEPSRGRTFSPAARRALAHRIHAFED